MVGHIDLLGGTDATGRLTERRGFGHFISQQVAGPHLRTARGKG